MLDPLGHDAPAVTVLGKARPRAKKEYICEFCRKQIAVGQRYYRISYKEEEDRRIYVSRTCSPNGECIDASAAD